VSDDAYKGRRVDCGAIVSRRQR